MLGRVTGIAALLAAVACAVCVATAAAGGTRPGSAPASGPLAAFLSCMKEHGAPAVGRLPLLPPKAFRRPAATARTAAARASRRHTLRPRISPADIAAWRKAFEACRAELPAHPARPGLRTPGHRFSPPDPARAAAFKACLADKGFAPGTGGKPHQDLRDPAKRAALRAALAACLPQLRPPKTS
jgi:hypothetical protein